MCKTRQSRGEVAEKAFARQRAAMADGGDGIEAMKGVESVHVTVKRVQLAFCKERSAIAAKNQLFLPEQRRRAPKGEGTVNAPNVEHVEAEGLDQQ